MAFPAPYLTGTSDLYPHRGELTAGTPWIRGTPVTSHNVKVANNRPLQSLNIRSSSVDWINVFLVTNNTKTCGLQFSFFFLNQHLVKSCQYYTVLSYHLFPYTVVFQSLLLLNVGSFLQSHFS